MSRTNKTRHISLNQTCVCNDKQCWNNNKCRYECKELIGKGRCDNRFILEPSICECKCDKSCDVI